MRRFVFMISILVCGVQVYGQYPLPRTYDFSKIDPKNIDREKLKQQLDSIWWAHQNAADSLNQLNYWIESKENLTRYASVDVGWGFGKSILTDLNAAVGSGIGKVPESVSAFHFGTTIRNKRLMFGYGIDDAKKQIFKDTDSKLKLDATSFDIFLGYDILNRPRFQFYPTVAFGISTLTIDRYKRNANSTISGYIDFFGDYTHSSMAHTIPSFQYGFQLDYHIAYSKRLTGIILGIKGGSMANLGDGHWFIEDDQLSFSSNDQFRKSYIVFMLKLYVKRKGRDDT